MEKAPKSVLGSVVKGFAFTFITGALMAGIFLGVTGGITALAPALAAEYGISAAFGLGKLLMTASVVGLSTGIFGGLIQGYSALTHNRQHAAFNAAAYSPTNGRDIAITAASHNLYSPTLQAAIDQLNQQQAQPQTAAPAPAAAPQMDAAPESTTFRDRVGGERKGITELLNRRLTDSSLSHADRISEARAASASNTGPTIH